MRLNREGYDRVVEEQRIGRYSNGRERYASMARAVQASDPGDVVTDCIASQYSVMVYTEREFCGVRAGVKTYAVLTSFEASVLERLKERGSSIVSPMDEIEAALVDTPHPQRCAETVKDLRHILGL